jgi:hypothetical protein
MTIHHFERFAIRAHRMALLVSLAAPFVASANGPGKELEIKAPGSRSHVTLGDGGVAIGRGMVFDDSFAGTINSAGRIVGRKHAGARAGHATSWSALSTMDLHDLRDAGIAGRHSDLPNAIYAHGWRAGDARRGPAGEPHGHVHAIASPVPEPETWAMLLFGLGVVGLWARLRKSDADGVR